MSLISNAWKYLVHVVVNWIYGSLLHRIVAQLMYFPTILRLMFREGPKSKWYNRVDDTVLLGALPFRSHTKQVT